MDSRLLGSMAVLAYLAAAAGYVRQRPRPGLFLAILAVLLHAIVLFPSTVTAQGINVELLNAASLVAWCIAVLAIVLNLRQNLSSLAAVLLPMVGLAVALDVWVPGRRVLTGPLPFGIDLHIALSIVAYSLFAVATIQAMLLAYATRQLRHHHPILDFLPPLPTMEAVMFQLTAIAFGLLTISLALGSAYIEDIRGQHLAHKIVFSLLAWGVFALLVYGRWRRGWRGRRGVKFLLLGFGLLALAFFGTKFVLEVILNRV